MSEYRQQIIEAFLDLVASVWRRVYPTAFNINHLAVCSAQDPNKISFHPHQLVHPGGRQRVNANSSAPPACRFAADDKALVFADGVELYKFMQLLRSALLTELESALEGSAASRARMLVKADGVPLVDFSVYHSSAAANQCFRLALCNKPFKPVMHAYNGVGVAQFLPWEDLIISSLCNVPVSCALGADYALLPRLPEQASLRQPRPRQGELEPTQPGHGVKRLRDGLVKMPQGDAGARDDAVSLLHGSVLPRVPALKDMRVDIRHFCVEFVQKYKTYQVFGRLIPVADRACLFGSGERHKRGVWFTIHADRVCFGEDSEQCKLRKPLVLSMSLQVDRPLMDYLYRALLPSAMRMLQ